MAYDMPDVYGEERTSLEGPIRPAASGFGILLGTTEKGPLRVPTRTKSFPAWTRIYGARQTSSDMAYEAEAFFAEGGVELITVRLAHYSDIDDNTTYAGGVASSTALTDGVEGAASKTGSIQTYNLDPGDTIVLDVDNVGNATITFDAVQAVREGSGLSIVDLDGDTLVLAFDGGEQQTVTFTSGATDADSAAAEINSQIVGGSAVVVTGEIDIYSDTYGTDSSVEIVSGTALTELGHSAGTATEATSDVGNINAVTALEVEDRIEDDSTALVTVNGDGSFTILSPTTGVTSELDFISGNALTPLGLSVQTIVGTAGTTYNTLKFEAGYHGTVSPGVDGDNVSRKITQSPKHATQGIGNDIAADITASDASIQVTTLIGIDIGSVIKVWDTTNTEYHEVQGVRSTVSGGSVSFYVDLTDTMTNSFTAASSQLQTQEFNVQLFYNGVEVEVNRWRQMSMLDTADNYVETLMNDDVVGSEYVVLTDLDAAAGLGADIPATDSAAVALTGGTDETVGMVDADWVGSQIGGTGMYSLDSVREFAPVAFVGNNNAAPVHAAANYVASRLYMEFITYATLGSTAAQVVNHRENVLGLGSSYTSMYAGGIKVFDPAGAGRSPKRSIVGLGALMGLRARVDNLPPPNGGPWEAPAGEGDYGTLKSALDVVDDYNDTDQGSMNSAHVNVIRKFGNIAPVTVWGARTLDATAAQQFRYVNTRRQFQFIEKSIVDSTRWGVFRNNDFRLWGKLKDRIDDFLSGLMPLRAFPSETKENAFFIAVGIDDGVMTEADKDNGFLIGEIGIAPHKPAEFIIFRFAQFEGGSTVEEL